MEHDKGLPPLLPQALARRLAYCRHHAARLRRELAALGKQARGYEARFAALPGLRAWTGPVLDAEEEAEWLATFELEAKVKLRDNCGAGPQRLLEARLAGLEREAELLAETLAEPPPPTSV
jgi:uncharacterized protein YigA (DUF484 family)